MLYFFHHYELPRVEQQQQQQQQHNTATRVPLIVGGHQLVAILHTPIRPFPHISLAVFASNNNDNRRIDDGDVSDDDIDDTSAVLELRDTIPIILQQLYRILIILQVKVLVTFVIDFITTQTHYYDDHYDNG